jgi:hypothetical protein
MNAKELLLRKLSVNYSNLLENFDSSIKKYKELSKKHPIVLITTKQKPTTEDLSKSFIFEEVSVEEGNEEEFEGLDDLDEDIQDLVDIFKHSKDSIKQQGETLELIQDKIEESFLNTEIATQHLKTASSYAGTFGLTLLGGLVDFVLIFSKFGVRYWRSCWTCCCWTENWPWAWFGFWNSWINCWIQRRRFNKQKKSRITNCRRKKNQIMYF